MVAIVAVLKTGPHTCRSNPRCRRRGSSSSSPTPRRWP
ncbi:hypothetical protein I553_0899 [Mycobacterium xenopi 4042]|uniref:Uncharacterized protein n=1 Tax=Mycobacterium xenopi 4042 TaxID=1299334 RepID=X8AHR9_MYCXE|nr:hypothetical protein I553_0899 [Mycobacterium xenopi 4042]